jgi:pimeloyl-ACP methyl ester carboxylesterase
MLNFRTSQSNASYSVSFQGPFDGASVTVNDVAPSPGNLAFPVRSDTNGFLHFSAVLTSQFAAPPNGDDAREALLTFQLQPAIEPPHLEFTGFSTTALNTGQLGVKVNLSASESASGPWNTSFSVSPNEDFYRFVSFSLQLGDNTIQLDLKALDIERFSEDVSLRVLAVTQSPIGSPSIPPQTNMAIIEIPLPVIFVHGYLGTSCGNPFGLSGSFVPSQKAGLFDYLVTQSTQVGISRIPYSESGDYPTLSMFNWIGIANDSAESIAERLRGHIANQLGATYATKVNLLTHSLGGLLARLAIDQGAPVRKLIMVGCPNNGTSYVWEMSSCLTLDKVNAIANGIVGYAVPRTDVFPFTTQGPYQKGNPCAIQPLALQRRTPPSLPSDPSLQIFNIFTSDSGTDTAWDYVATFQKKQNWYGFTRRALRIAQGCDSRTVWSFYRIGDGVISVQDATLGIGLDIRVQTDEKVNGFGFPHALQLQNAAVLEAIARALGLLK